MKPPAGISLRADSMSAPVPSWAEGVFQQLNAFSAQVISVLARGITRGDNLASNEKLGLVFTTKATPADTFPIKVAHGLSENPKHVQCTKLERDDGTAITDVYSMTWANSSGGQVLVSFQGLTGSKKYRANFTFE